MIILLFAGLFLFIYLAMGLVAMLGVLAASAALVGWIVLAVYLMGSK